jgi:hypothetical protein
VGLEVDENGKSYTGVEEFQGASESVASTDDIPVKTDVQASPEVIRGNKPYANKFCTEKDARKTSSILAVGFWIALLAIFASLKCIYLQDDDHHMVPT